MPHSCQGQIQVASRHIDGQFVTAYAVDASPALAVNHGVLELCPRRPSLVVSGINSGANVSVEVTVSGTVGAALEGAAFGIPSLAVSLEMDANYHLIPNYAANYETSMLYIHRFGQCLLQCALAGDVDVLNINVPAGARG